jgi:hypothetical protein
MYTKIEHFSSMLISGTCVGRALFTLLWLTATLIMTQSAMLRRVDLHCDQYFEWKQYVLKHCDEDTELLKLKWNDCENLSDPSDKDTINKFKVIYEQCQKTYVYCHEWYKSEKKAANSCSSQSSHRTWVAEIWPMYCDSIFKKYEKERKTIESTCARTSYSDRFWEGFAEFVASPLCKNFYENIRSVHLFKCNKHNQTQAYKCNNIFRWYTQNKAKVERDCFETDQARSFYDAFYTWRETHY